MLTVSFILAKFTARNSNTFKKSRTILSLELQFSTYVPGHVISQKVSLDSG